MPILLSLKELPLIIYTFESGRLLLKTIILSLSLNCLLKPSREVNAKLTIPTYTQLNLNAPEAIPFLLPTRYI